MSEWLRYFLFAAFGTAAIAWASYAAFKAGRADVLGNTVVVFPYNGGGYFGRCAQVVGRNGVSQFACATKGTKPEGLD